MSEILSRSRAVVLGVVGVALLLGAWDLYAAFGPDEGVRAGGETYLLPRADDTTMPHTWDVVRRLGEPVNAVPGAPDVLRAVVDASTFTLAIAARGFVVGVLVGLVLALVMSRFRIAESALLPWIVLSQTVPLIALAPVVRRWGSQIEIAGQQWTNDQSVAVIAAYLAFFPVAVGALRGLKAPDRTHVDLFHAYGVGWWRGLLALRLPSSVPYLLPALRLAAASAVIGTIVAEVSLGLKGGIGRMFIDYTTTATSDPAKSFAPILGAIAVGLVAAAVVGLIGLLLRPYRPAEATR
ncbi:ABC transporter permease [Nocardioides sp.]|uniref:ABC transporter permease n=1 Tax=Nocardioides sp. TaxID=35761 RepID=UPI0027285479|nr:ABC transporter permease subunit [Nocardioides sp.]MDO9457908.1 ABC transporter permease subunit [Nocardioides sp.]